MTPNDADRWFKSGANPKDKSGNLAVNRLNNPVLQRFPDATGSFSKETTFFMIGSCFARGLESVLNGKGFKVLSLTDEFSQWKTVNDKVKPIGATNRYNTGSILNDFCWAMDPDTPFPEEAYAPYKSGTFIDLHMNPQLPPASLDEIKARRAVWNKVTANLRNADVVTITLGLIEVWRDKQLDLICNTTPDGYVHRSNPGRFSFEILDYNDNLENLEKIHQLMAKYGKDGWRLVVTVSPVPLLRTFTNKDIIQANTYSKSVLRAAAEAFADRHDNVDYFPSYEIVMNSKKKITWTDDKRHIHGKFTQKIMEQFFSAYDMHAG